MWQKISLGWHEINKQMGFHLDERVEANHLVGLRWSYLFQIVLFPVVGWYQQKVSQQPGAFYVTATAVSLSLLYLAIRYVQVSRFPKNDERGQTIIKYSFRSASLMLLLILLAYYLFLFWWVGGWSGLNQLRGMFWWGPAMIFSQSPLFMTHFRRKSYENRVWRYLLLSFLLSLAVGYAAASFFVKR